MAKGHTVYRSLLVAWQVGTCVKKTRIDIGTVYSRWFGAKTKIKGEMVDNGQRLRVVIGPAQLRMRVRLRSKNE